MQPDVRTGNGGAAVWIVEDSVDYRHALQELIEGQQDLRCPQTFGSGEELLAHLSGHFAPEVVIVDIGLPGMSGIELIRRLNASSPGTHVVCLTIHDDSETIFEAICAGACGYLLKTATPSQILDALRDARRGGMAFPPAIARRVLDLFDRLRSGQSNSGLADLEHEVRAKLRPRS